MRQRQKFVLRSVPCVLWLTLLPAARLIAQADTGEAGVGEAESQALPKLEIDDTPIEPPMPTPRPPKLTGDSPIRPTPIPRKPNSAAEMLQFFNVDESLLRQLIDHRPLHDDENEAVVRILFALPKLPAEYLQQWTETSPDWDAIIEDPQEYRTSLYQLQGRVTRVERIPLIPEAAERFNFEHYYQATVELGEDRWTATVCARRVPLGWKIGEPIDEPVSLRGMLLKMGDGPVFAANRIAWHPNRLDEQANITRSHVYLGDLGMDVGLWDDVRDRRPLEPSGRECFYQLLDTMGRTRQNEVRARSRAALDIADALRNPQAYHGRLLTLRGSARRCAKVIVSDPDIRARFGIEHYYEIYLLVELDTKIVYKDETTGKTVEFQTFPIAVCARQLPPGMPEGDDIYEALSVSGVFFKLWAYRSDKMSAFHPGQKQLCPMLVSLQPDLLPRESISPYIGMAVGGLFIVALLGVWISVWRFGRDDAQFAKTTLKRQYELESGASLDALGIEARGGPDFSHLAVAAEEAALSNSAASEPKPPTLTASVRGRVSQSISERRDPAELRDYLLDQGFKESDLDAIYAEFGYTGHKLRQRHREAKHNRTIGSLLIALAAVISAGALFAGALSGIVIVLALGLIAYGLVMLMTGENFLANLFFQRQSFVKTAKPDPET